MPTDPEPFDQARRRLADEIAERPDLDVGPTAPYVDPALADRCPSDPRKLAADCHICVWNRKDAAELQHTLPPQKRIDLLADFSTTIEGMLSPEQIDKLGRHLPPLPEWAYPDGAMPIEYDPMPLASQVDLLKLERDLRAMWAGDSDMAAYDRAVVAENAQRANAHAAYSARQMWTGMAWLAGACALFVAAYELLRAVIR